MITRGSTPVGAVIHLVLIRIVEMYANEKSSNIFAEVRLHKGLWYCTYI